MTTQLSFATRSEGPLQEVTERRPGLAIDAYPLGRLLLLRCFGEVDGIDVAAEINGPGGKVLHATRTGDEVTLLLDGSDREEEIIASLADQSAHLIPPSRFEAPPQPEARRPGRLFVPSLLAQAHREAGAGSPRGVRSRLLRVPAEGDDGTGQPFSRHRSEYFRTAPESGRASRDPGDAPDGPCAFRQGRRR